MQTPHHLTVFCVFQTLFCYGAGGGTYQWNDWSSFECDVWKCTRTVDCDGRLEIWLLSSGTVGHVGKYVNKFTAGLWNVLFGGWNSVASPGIEDNKWKCFGGNAPIERGGFVASGRVDSQWAVEGRER